MRKVVRETSLRYHVEGTDYVYPEDDDWHFLKASNILELPGSKTETAKVIQDQYMSTYRKVRIVDTWAEEN